MSKQMRSIDEIIEEYGEKLNEKYRAAQEGSIGYNYHFLIGFMVALKWVLGEESKEHL